MSESVTVRSMMLTVGLFGSAVYEVLEAQSVMMLVMFILMVPYALGFPIARDPNSALSTAFSFIPGINGFAIWARAA